MKFEKDVYWIHHVSQLVCLFAEKTTSGLACGEQEVLESLCICPFICGYFGNTSFTLYLAHARILPVQMTSHKTRSLWPTFEEIFHLVRFLGWHLHLSSHRCRPLQTSSVHVSRHPRWPPTNLGHCGLLQKIDTWQIFLVRLVSTHDWWLRNTVEKNIIC